MFSKDTLHCSNVTVKTFINKRFLFQINVFLSFFYSSDNPEKAHIKQHKMFSTLITITNVRNHDFWRIKWHWRLMKIPTWSHKNTYLCVLTVRHRLTYLTVRFARSFKEKCPLSGAKTLVKYVNAGTFYYVDIDTYCCVFIALLQKRIAAVQNSNIQGRR